MRKHVWTPEQDRICQELHAKEDRAGLLAFADKLHISYITLRNHMRRDLGLKALFRAKKIPNCTPWTESEDALMKEYYTAYGPKKLLELLPSRSRSAILCRARKLGLKVREGLRRERVLETLKADGRYYCFPSYGKVIGHVLGSYRRGADERGIECPLLDGSIENVMYLDSIATDRCALSGRPLVYATYPVSGNTSNVTASLDRIDSTKGYVKGNVQWVDKWVNQFKMDLTDDEVIALCCDVARYRGGMVSVNNNL